MSKSHRLIDSDSHILEPPDLFEKYLEPKFRKTLWDNALKLYPIQPE